MELSNNDEADSAIIMAIYHKDRIFPLFCCLWSLVNQTISNYKVFICIDGFVSADIKNLLNFYSRKFNFIYVVSKDKNSGLAKSLNHLIEFCLKEHPNILYYFRMDADDICCLNRIQVQRDYLNHHPEIDVLGGACKEFGLYSKIIKKPESDSEIKQNIIKITPFIHPTVVFRKRIFEQMIRYPEKTHLSEDLALWLTLSKMDKCFHNLPEIVLYYRLNSSTLDRRMSIKKASSEFIMRLSYIKKSKENIISNFFYCIGHFTIRIMPVSISKIFYKILR